jgi:hypothetical protein
MDATSLFRPTRLTLFLFTAASGIDAHYQEAMACVSAAHLSPGRHRRDKLMF